jgi:hypothetical protein
VSTLIARNPALVCDLLDITTRWNAIVEAT